MVSTSVRCDLLKFKVEHSEIESVTFHKVYANPAGKYLGYACLPDHQTELSISSGIIWKFLILQIKNFKDSDYLSSYSE
jgi:hypothetical protein